VMLGNLLPPVFVIGRFATQINYKLSRSGKTCGFQGRRGRFPAAIRGAPLPRRIRGACHAAKCPTVTSNAATIPARHPDTPRNR
jgi:hypothetical protein